MTFTYNMMMDSIRQVRQLMPVAPPRFIPSMNVPPERYPYCQIWIGHPWIVRLSKYLKFSPWVWRESEIVEHRHAYRIGGDFYMHPSLYAIFKREAAVISMDNVA